MTQKEKLTYEIKTWTKEAGFDFCGISKAEFLEREAPRLENWLQKNYHGKMAYMANYFDKRLDPRLLVDDAKSVITVLLNYYPEEFQDIENSNYKISKYAYGTDYHYVIKNKLKLVLEKMQKSIGDFSARIFVDSAPVMDKVWAEKSGLGWIGKNANLISKGNGSFFFIGEIICDIPLLYDSKTKDYCGTCSACLDACPTDAIVSPYVVDGSRCISYFTIELKEAIPNDVKGKFENWAFGCDICQDVCPWNRFSKANSMPEFKILDEIKTFSKKDWEEITEEIFKDIFKNSPIKRSKFEGFKENITFLKE